VTARAIGAAGLLLALLAGCGTAAPPARTLPPAGGPPPAGTPAATPARPAAADAAGLGAAPTAGPSKRPITRTPSARPSRTRTSPPPPANAAARLRTLPAGTRQVVIVSSDGYGTSHAALETYARRDGAWRRVHGPMAARIGGTGFRDTKVEGDLATPTGVYGFGGTMYGIAPDPGVRYAYHRLVANDWWNENPATPGYNSFQHGPDPGGASEALWTTAPQYDHFAVITYNIPVRPADPPRGSGIFLHVMVPGRATAGCVALAPADLATVLRWLDPAAAPRIVMAPVAELDRF
jgi:L,D-peptidoglycan transpeptidase YkuD (ErfK/YbiS/YcfS/YnhG family)